MTVHARPARFDRATSHRRAMLAKIHVARAQLRLAEDDYRQILLEETGKRSAADCSEEALARVIARLKRLGWQPLPKGGPAQRPAQHPVARKARALWLSLYHLGAVRSGEESALEAFARRQLGCARLVWANQRQGYRLIEALKAMAEKHGWAQTDGKGNNLPPRALKEGLCQAILAKLKQAGEIPQHWHLDEAAFRLCGIELGADGPVSAEGYDTLAAALGRKLREAGGAA